MEILHCRKTWKRFAIRSDYGSTGCRQELRLDPSVSPQNTCFKPPLFQEPIHAHVPSRCHNEFIFHIIVFMWFMCMFGGGPCSTALQLELVWFLRSGRLRMRFAQRTVNMSGDPKSQTVWSYDLYLMDFTEGDAWCGGILYILFRKTCLEEEVWDKSASFSIHFFL